ncbi:MAG: TlpA disulfide reductase family protein [Cyclobacteriaceae bacterium]
MKRIIVPAIFLFLSLAQGIAKQASEGDIHVNSKTIIKDESGGVVPLTKFMEMINSGEWTVQPVNDSSGALQYLQLKRLSDKEQQLAPNLRIPRNSDLLGKAAPDFKMKDMKGNLITSDNTRGKVVVLNFWFTTCMPCIGELPQLNALYREFQKNSNVVFASITFEKDDKVSNFLVKYPLRYPVITSAMKICQKFDISAYPTNIVIDKNGNYYEHITGAFPNVGKQLSLAIQKALKKKD